MVTKCLLQRCREGGLGRCVIALLAMVLSLSGCMGSSDAPAPPAVTPVVQQNSIISSVLEAGDVVAYVGQPKTITLSFKTTDGAAVSDFTAVPLMQPGWQISSGNVSCATVTGEGSCRFGMTYTPTEPTGSSTIRINFTYNDNAGKLRSNSISVNYSALTANAAMVTQSPAGIVRGMVGRSSAITLDFGTHDGSAASALKVDGASLASLPAGWTSDSPGLNCPVVGGSASCQLRLVYNPPAAAPEGAFTIGYNYVDSSGKPRSGATAIAYLVVSSNTVLAERVPVDTLRVLPDALGRNSKNAVVTFRSSDGVATNLRITSDLSQLPPAGWSVSGTTGCNTVAQDDQCRLTLTYAPTQAVGLSKLVLVYKYTSNTGEELTGSVDIPYDTVEYQAYASVASGNARQCAVDENGLFSDCADAGMKDVRSMTINGSHAYVITGDSAFSASGVATCAIGRFGELENCVAVRTPNVVAGVARGIAISGQWAFILFGDTDIARCMISSNGSVTNCALVPKFNRLKQKIWAMANVDSDFYFIQDNVKVGGKWFYLCTLTNASGNLSCDSSPEYILDNSVIGVIAPTTVAGRTAFYLTGGSLPILPDGRGGSAILACEVMPRGLSCPATGASPDRPVGFDSPYSVSTKGASAYVADGDAVYKCAINQDNGMLSDCQDAGLRASQSIVGVAIR
jgi:hypothetical protein